MKYAESIYNIRVPMKEGRQLLFNSLSRGMVLLEADDVRKLDRLKTQPTPAQLSELYHETDIQYLGQEGFIVRAGTDEVSTVRDLYYEARHDPSGLNFVVCSTLACNFGCDYCFQGIDKPLESMSPEVMDKAVALYERLVKSKPDLRQMQMIWYGGEPLMRPKVIYEMADRLIDINTRANIHYTASMVSNGFMMTREVAYQLFIRGLKSVQITLDGSQEFHDARRHLLNKKGTYVRILQNVREWIDEIPIAVNIRVNIDERNKKGITRLIDDLQERGFGGRDNFKMYFSPVESNTTACHNVSDLTMQKMQYGQLEAFLYRYAYERGLVDLPYPTRFLGICSALRPNDYIIVPNGDVHKCWDTVSFPEKRIGTVFEPDALFAAQGANSQLWAAFDPFQNEICSSCKLLPSCASYCAHKFIYASDSAGDSVLPCPSIKYSINERLVFRAEMEGVITRDDYDAEAIKTNPYELTPRMHTADSMRKTKAFALPTLEILSQLVTV